MCCSVPPKIFPGSTAVSSPTEMCWVKFLNPDWPKHIWMEIKIGKEKQIKIKVEVWDELRSLYFHILSSSTIIQNPYFCFPNATREKRAPSTPKYHPRPSQSMSLLAGHRNPDYHKSQPFIQAQSKVLLSISLTPGAASILTQSQWYTCFDSGLGFQN